MSNVLNLVPRQMTFNDLKTQLSDNDIDQILAILGYRCRVGTIRRMRSVLTYAPSAIPTYGILSRLMKDGDTWSYCAGQSYPDEIRTIKEIILKEF
jgi:hypothetical protein